MNKITVEAFLDELSKIADAVHPLPGGAMHIDPNELSDPNDPNDPITRYQSMQRRKPIARDIVRESAIGAVASPALMTLSDVLGKGVKETFKRPEIRDAAGKVTGHGSHFGAGGYGRKLTAAAGIGTIAASALPLIKAHMGLKAEEENVKQQLGITPDTGVRSALRRTVGVG
jgi:hypothetical protein